MEVPKIPNNSLTEEIKEIVKLCQEFDDDYESYFYPHASEEAMTEWEQKNGIKIPESYKDWLRFSNGSRICGILANFYSVERLIIGINIEGVVNSNLVIIGSMIGNGTFICFSRTTNKICREDHGEITEFENFKCVLNHVMDIM